MNLLHLVPIIYLPGFVCFSASLLLALVFTVRKPTSQSLCETTPTLSDGVCVFHTLCVPSRAPGLQLGIHRQPQTRRAGVGG